MLSVYYNFLLTLNIYIYFLFHCKLFISECFYIPHIIELILFSSSYFFSIFKLKENKPLYLEYIYLIFIFGVKNI